MLFHQEQFLIKIISDFYKYHLNLMIFKPFFINFGNLDLSNILRLRSIISIILISKDLKICLYSSNLFNYILYL
jgi:hypothetical protein